MRNEHERARDLQVKIEDYGYELKYDYSVPMGFELWNDGILMSYSGLSIHDIERWYEEDFLPEIQDGPDNE